MMLFSTLEAATRYGFEPFSVSWDSRFKRFWQTVRKDMGRSYIIALVEEEPKIQVPEGQGK